MKVSVTSGTRLHFGLLNVARNCPVKDGGIGLSVHVPSLIVTAELCDNLAIVASKIATRVAHHTLLRLSGAYEVAPVRLQVQVKERFHQGFGFSTQTKLSIAYATLLCSGYSRAEIADLRLAELLRIGGTSAIGLGAFLEGGIILDLGHRRKRSVGPSGYGRVWGDDIMFETTRFPPWVVVLAMPANMNSFTLQQERALFAECAPIPLDEATLSTYYAVFGVWRAAKAGRYGDFCSGIDNMRRIGFKKREVSIRCPGMMSVFDLLSRAGLGGVSMSSWGPLAFGFCEDAGQLNRRVLDEACQRGELVEYFVTEAENRCLSERVNIRR